MRDCLLNSFANITRLRILTCLADQPKNVTELIRNCRLSQSAVSQHLKKLKDAGLVTCARQGKEAYYQLKYPHAAQISRELQILSMEVSNEHRLLSKK